MEDKETINIRTGVDLRKHLENQAVKRKMRLTTYIKAVLKKYTKFKEKELI
jgi:hypothetical protein